MRQSRAVVSQTAERWAISFVYDGPTIRQRACIRPSKYTRACALFCDIARLLNHPGERVGALLSIIQCYSGTKFTSGALDHWAHWGYVQLDPSRPSRLGDNSVWGAFEGSFRWECVPRHWLASVAAARTELAAWREP